MGSLGLIVPFTVIGAAAAAHLSGALWWKGAAVALAGLAGLAATRYFGLSDQALSVFAGFVAAGGTGQALGLTAQQTGIIVAGGAAAGLLPALLATAG